MSRVDDVVSVARGVVAKVVAKVREAVDAAVAAVRKVFGV